MPNISNHVLRLRRSFLQHGSMPLTVNREALASATRMPSVQLLEGEMAGCAEFLSSRPSLQELTMAFVRAFQEYFSIEFQRRGGLTVAAVYDRRI